MAFVSPAVVSLEIIHSVFETVKSNKERLRSIVKRCEIVVESLELTVRERERGLGHAPSSGWSDVFRIERLVR